MQTILITYQIRPDRLDEHLALLAPVHQELAQLRPAGFRYLTLRLRDSNRFVDIAMGPDLPGPLAVMESFRRYRTELEERCTEREVSEFTVVGSYNMGE